MAHCNTILHQMLKFISRYVIDKLDREQRNVSIFLRHP